VVTHTRSTSSDALTLLDNPLAYISVCFMFVLWFNFFIFFHFFYSVPTIAQLLHTLVRSFVSAISSLSGPQWCGSFIAALSQMLPIHWN